MTIFHILPVIIFAFYGVSTHILLNNKRLAPFTLKFSDIRGINEYTSEEDKRKILKAVDKINFYTFIACVSINYFIYKFMYGSMNAIMVGVIATIIFFLIVYYSMTERIISNK